MPDEVQEIRDNSEDELEAEILREQPGLTMSTHPSFNKEAENTFNSIQRCTTTLKGFQKSYDELKLQRKQSLQTIRQHEADIQQLEQGIRVHTAAFQLLRRLLSEIRRPNQILQEALQARHIEIEAFDDEAERLNVLIVEERRNLVELQAARKIRKSYLIVFQKQIAQLKAENKDEEATPAQEQMTKKSLKRRRDDEDDETGPSARRAPNSVGAF